MSLALKWFTRFLRAILKTVNMNLKIKIGSVILFIIIVTGIFGPLLDDFRLKGRKATEIGLTEPYLLPSLEFPLGTDQYGRDVLGLINLSIGYTLSIGALSGTLAVIIAIIVGFVSGYRGGIWDHALRSLADGMLVIPSWPIIAIISVYVRYVDFFTFCLVIALFSWAGMARSIRSQVLSLKERPYVDLAKASGLGEPEIIFREILPNFLPYLSLGFASSLIGTMVAETGIRFLGVGPAWLPTLGYFINLYINSGYLTSRPLVLMVPVSILCLIFFSLNLINAGLEEIYNPRLKKITGL